MIFENKYGFCEIEIKDQSAVAVNVSGGPDSTFLLWAVAKSVIDQEIIVKVLTHENHMVLDNVKKIIEKMKVLFPSKIFKISHIHTDGTIPTAPFLQCLPFGTTQVFNGFQCNPSKDELKKYNLYESRDLYKDRNRQPFPYEFNGQYWPMRYTCKQWLAQAIKDYDLHWINDLTSTCDVDLLNRPCKKCHGCLERKAFMGSFDFGIK